MGIRRVRSIELEDLRLPIATVEYVIVRKLSYSAQSGSTRHVEDIARIRRAQDSAIDMVELGRWIDRLGLRDA